MSDTNATPNETPETPVVSLKDKETVTKRIFDLNEFDEVELVKIVEFTALTTWDQIMDAVSKDEAKMIAVVNAGLLSEAKKVARDDESGWHTYGLAEGEIDEETMNGPFAGVQADIKKVNAMVLQLAKAVFGFSKSLSREGKKVAKAKAQDFVRSNDTIREGLRSSAV
jgi:hypothetical protein